MSQIQIHFAYPWSGWLLFLLIPAIAVPLILHFKVAKRYRRTRNRIISLVLHLTISVLSVAALSGMIFTYRVDNPENEVILLVDVSDTEETSALQRDILVQQLIEESGESGIRTGVVTFGFDQKYAVPLTDDTNGIYERYREAEKPDTSATDVAAALKYTTGLFSDSESSKIVLITDGKETDERANSAIGTIVAQGYWVDVVYVSSEYTNDNVQVVGIALPDYHVNVGEECDIGVTVRSKVPTVNTVIELADNDVLNEETGRKTVDLNEGRQLVTFRYTFTENDLHELKIRIRQEGDGLEANDEYCAYIYLEVFDKVLVLERYAGQSDELDALLTQDGVDYQVDVKNIVNSDDIPSDIEGLRKYDQVILNNVSNADLQLHPGLDELLYSYVYDYGGGLFTVGGSDDAGEAGEAHAYNREDMAGTLYQQMLPVQAIDYTPPVGVIFIVDISSSMDFQTGYGTSKRDAAKQGLTDLVRNQVLTEKDYMGIMTLDTVYGVVLPLTRFSRSDTLLKAIDGIDGLGGTVFSQAINRAGQQLTDQKDIERRHIVIITDGEPTGGDADAYLGEAAQNYRNSEITLSVVGIGMSEGSSAYIKMSELVEVGHGELYVTGGRLSDIADKMREDLKANALGEVVPEPFHPVATKPLSNLFNGVEFGSGSNRNTMEAQLGGFYGVKVRAEDYLILEGEYSVPIYAQWKFGKGSVGSFMCDLSGRWSSEFLQDGNGQRFLLNVVSNLMPMENIHPSDISYRLEEENYISKLSVDAGLGDGETVSGTILTPEGESISLNAPPGEEEANPDVYVTRFLGAPTYSDCEFVIKKSGTYTITLNKLNANGEVTDTVRLFKTFSFSEEYNLFPEEEGEETSREMLLTLTGRSKGNFIENEEDSYLIFDDFETTLGRTFDPRILFMILVIVLFLLDIAVRKFKFKWIHELVREHRQKKEAAAANKRTGGVRG